MTSVLLNGWTFLVGTGHDGMNGGKMKKKRKYEQLSEGE